MELGGKQSIDYHYLWRTWTPLKYLRKKLESRKNKFNLWNSKTYINSADSRKRRRLGTSVWNRSVENYWMAKFHFVILWPSDLERGPSVRWIRATAIKEAAISFFLCSLVQTNISTRRLIKASVRDVIAAAIASIDSRCIRIAIPALWFARRRTRATRANGGGALRDRRLCRVFFFITGTRSDFHGSYEVDCHRPAVTGHEKGLPAVGNILCVTFFRADRIDR